MQEINEKVKSRLRTLSKNIALLVLLLITFHKVNSQNIFPVQSTVQLVPPYSVYLPDYANPGTDKLRVILLQKDLTQASYQIRLYLSVALNGKVIMRTSRSFNAPPISLNAGVPTIFSGADLSPYLDSRNLDFVGYSREQYERTHTLPEGSFQICVTAFDYVRQEVQVSNMGCSFYYLAKSEPPLINLPACGSKVPGREPQQTVFSWMPRNTSSPNSAASTEYEFNLYEVRIAGRNPNDVVMSSAPVFTITTDFTQLIYGPADPPLIEGMQYVWRVQAKDKDGRDLYRNNGFSETCTFTYGGTDPNFVIGLVKDFSAEVKSERKARLHWTVDLQNFDSYKVYYKKKGDDSEWFFQETKEGEIKINDLEPETEYEGRIQGKKKGFFGEYTEIITFVTPKKRVVQCGQLENIAAFTPGNPLIVATKGMGIMARGMEVRVTEITSLGSGWFKGKGYLPVYYLGGASYKVTFDRIYIDENHNVSAGRIDIMSRPIDAMADEQLVNQEDRKKAKQQEENREKFENEGVEFYEKVFMYDEFSIKDVTISPSGEVIITDADGKQYTNPNIQEARAANPNKAIIIEDKNGDQVVIKKDGTVEKVPGGGLKAGGSITLSQTDINLISKALELIKDETKEKKSFVSEELDALKLALAQFNKSKSIETDEKVERTSLILHLNQTALEEKSALPSEVVNKATEYFSNGEKLLYSKVLSVLATTILKSKEFGLIATIKINESSTIETKIKEMSSSGAAEEQIIKTIKEEVENFTQKQVLKFLNN